MADLIKKNGSQATWPVRKIHNAHVCIIFKCYGLVNDYTCIWVIICLLCVLQSRVLYCRTAQEAQTAVFEWALPVFPPGARLQPCVSAECEAAAHKSEQIRSDLLIVMSQCDVGECGMLSVIPHQNSVCGLIRFQTSLFSATRLIKA